MNDELTQVICEACEIDREEKDVQRRRSQIHKRACEAMKQHGIRECSVTVGDQHVAVRRSGMQLHVKALPCADGGRLSKPETASEQKKAKVETRKTD